ncbi:MAG TPA: histidine kinase [Streptosporangiaceae bacterium]|nr:histidine kinase [Streptosporangiaceae bacterium]
MSALYAWLRRHPRLVDGVLAAALAFGGIAEALTLDRDALILVVIGMTVPVVVRRRHPTGAFAAAVAVGAVQVVAHLRPLASDLAILVLLYTLAAYTSRRTSAIGLGICLLGSALEVVSLRRTVLAVSATEWALMGLIVFAGPSLIAWVLGDSMRYRRAHYANLEERAARLERDRDAQAQIAAAAERARIARELHDVVAHNVSVMVVQADGAAYALGSDPGRAREALAAISATGRQALTEMRVLLGVLRRSDGDAQGTTLAPLPGLGQLDELLEQTRAAGLPVSCAVDGEPRPLPGGAALAAYRIVQESLTNTRKHAGPLATAQVRLRYDDDALELTVTDNGVGVGGAAACDGAGHGLTGMRERAAMYGGTVQVGPRAEGGFGVTARLPVAKASALSAESAA